MGEGTLARPWADGLPLSPMPYDASDKHTSCVNSLAMSRIPATVLPLIAALVAFSLAYLSACGGELATGPAPFKLDWDTSASAVDIGESFTLAVRMYDVQQAGEHGGISVSFPLLTEAGSSSERYSSEAADVEALNYTTGLPRVAFHQPGAAIYHKDNNRMFPAPHLLVETDDPIWHLSEDRTLTLRITPKRGGNFP